MIARSLAKGGAVWLCILLTGAVFTALGNFRTLAGNTAEVTFYVH